jgi:23S rRNA (cytidine2498-2'-O)-methyltransferase
VRGDKTASGAKPARREKPVRGDRPAAGAKPARREKPVRGDRPAAGAKPARREKPVRGDRPARAEKPVRGDRPARAEKPVRGDRPARAPKFAGTNKPARPAKFAGAEKRPKTGFRPERPARGEKPVFRAERPLFGEMREPPAPRADNPQAHGRVPDKATAKGAAKIRSEELRAKHREPRPAPPPISVVSAEPHPGMWLLTSRLGAERDVVDELLLAKVVDPAARVLAPAVVLAPKLPKREGHPMELAFARQGFEILLNVRTHDLDQMVTRIARSVRGQLMKAERYALHAWVPDSDQGNALSNLAEELENRIAARLEQLLPESARVDDSSLRRMGSLPFVQVCLLETGHAVAGVIHSNRAFSLARGGRTRVRITGEFPSRAARKVEEALAWLGDAPGAGEQCVDLGAAPGGWTYMLLKRKARVVAVDPAKLKPDILATKGVEHVQESAFTYTPDMPVDWLFCDMAWRPLEVAALLAKWGRRRWARMLVANVKLPMTRKAEIVARVRDILVQEGNWKNVHIKQLYHDREEVTITAHLG